MPRLGLLRVAGDLDPADVAAGLGGVVAEADDLARLRGGGVEALPRRLARIVEARGGAEGLGALKRDLTRARRDMLEAVVPPTILYLTIGGTLALGVLAFSFVWPEYRSVFFPASGAVLAALVGYAVVQSVRSARTQRRLQQRVYDLQDAVEAARALGRRPHALVAAAGLSADPDGLSAACRQAAERGWEGDAGDPDVPLVVPAALLTAGDATWLAPWARGRLVVVVGDAEGPFDQVLEPRVAS